MQLRWADSLFISGLVRRNGRRWRRISLGTLSGSLCASLPRLSDASDQRRVNDQVPKRCDPGHICLPAQTVRLHQNGHLAAISARVVGNPAEMQHPVHRPVDDLRRPLVVRQVDRDEGERVELGPGRTVT